MIYDKDHLVVLAENYIDDDNNDPVDDWKIEWTRRISWDEKFCWKKATYFAPIYNTYFPIAPEIGQQ